jgi:glycosyltransferase involved in cell wall biosynthesis
LKNDLRRPLNLIAKIAHLTSIHNILDNRIFYRECRSLAAAGYDVALVAQHDRDELRDGIRILAVPPPRSRLERVTLTAFRVVRRAWREQPAVFHLHDPELIPWGMLLRLLGRQVIYDVHEDFSQAAAVRPWIPGPLRSLIARCLDVVAWLAGRSMSTVIAERYYERRFPAATKVLNYPHRERSMALQAIERRPERQPDRIRLLYVGSVTVSRGALLHAELATRLPGCELVMSGICEPAVAARITALGDDANVGLIAADGEISWERRSRQPAHLASTILLEGVGFFVPPESMLRLFEEDWTSCIAIFPFSEHYYEKELTKFFEYMAAGLPIVSSNFPTWRVLVEQPGAGIAVDPADWNGIIAAIEWLHDHPKEAVDMGLNGRRAVQEHFNWQSQADNLLGLYQRLIGDPRIGQASPAASQAAMNTSRQD